MGGTSVAINHNTVFASTIGEQSKSVTNGNDGKDADGIAKSSKIDQSTDSILTQAVDLLKENKFNFTKIYAGYAGESNIDQAAASINAKKGSELKTDGYLIKAGEIDGKKVLVLEGKDQTGLFYAVKSLITQLENKQDISGIDIYESPRMSIRGVIEGFYGKPWSHQARKDLFKFMGEHRLNTYIYTPKDDEYLRKNWKDLYPQKELDTLKDLVKTAEDSHVQFVYALSPGNDITYSSDTDYEATVKKFDQLKAIGVKQFYIALDDIPLELNKTDAAKFPNHATTNYSKNSWSGLADAQTYYLNKVQKDYIEKNNLPDLWLVPTNYNGSKQDPFKEAQGEKLDKHIRMQWTGQGVFSAKIGADEVAEAKQTYHSDHLFIWDNFPVNDSNFDRLYLNPLEGRASDLDTQTDGFTANPMVQPYASWIALAGYGDYTWNPATYDADKTQKNILDEIAGSDAKIRQALDAFVDLNQYWDYADKSYQKYAPELSKLFDDFKAAKPGTADYQTKLTALRDRLEIIKDGENSLKQVAVKGFYDDALPWIQAAADWAKASEEALNLFELTNQSGNNEQIGTTMLKMQASVDDAHKKRTVNSRPDSNNAPVTPTVGDGVFDKIIDSAYNAIDQYLGRQELKDSAKQIKAVKAEKSTSLPTYADNNIENIIDGDTKTKFWSGDNPKNGDYVQIDLGKVAKVQRIVLHQGPDDTVNSGDVFTNADIMFSKDGKTWNKVGEIGSAGLSQVDLSSPAETRYVRILCTKATAHWLQIRELAVYDKSGLATDNVESSAGSPFQTIFDGKSHTSFVGKDADPTKVGKITLTTDQPIENAKSIWLIGHVNGTLYVQTKDGWQKVGQVSDKDQVTQLPVKADKITGTRIDVDPTVKEFTISELALSNKKVTVKDNGGTSFGTVSTTPEKPNEKPEEQPVERVTNKVQHNAYLYDKAGKRIGNTILKAGSTVETQGTIEINGRKFYVLADHEYLAASNIDPQKRTLKHNTYVYNKKGHRTGKKLKKGKTISIYGSTVKIKGRTYYSIGNNHYVRKGNVK